MTPRGVAAARRSSVSERTEKILDEAGLRVPSFGPPGSGALTDRLLEQRPRLRGCRLDGGPGGEAGAVAGDERGNEIGIGIGNRRRRRPAEQPDDRLGIGEPGSRIRTIGGITAADAIEQA